MGHGRDGCHPSYEGDPETARRWISLPYALRRTESVENAEAILLGAQAIHSKVAMIALNQMIWHR
jgi:hypothetical protein